MLLIGIDPGKENGFAAYYTTLKKFTAIKTLKTFEVIEHLMALLERKEPFKVYIEDPNTFKYHGKDQSHKLQGAGSVKARFRVIVEFMDFYGIDYEKRSIQGTVKYDALTFKKITKYEKSTSQHGRDAGMLVYGL